jgi:hypothetical protein
MMELIIVGAAVGLAAAYVIFKAVKALRRTPSESPCAGCAKTCGECTMGKTGRRLNDS